MLAITPFFVACFFSSNPKGVFAIVGIEKNMEVLVPDSLQGRAPFSLDEKRVLAYSQRRIKLGWV